MCFGLRPQISIATGFESFLNLELPFSIDFATEKLNKNKFYISKFLKFLLVSDAVQERFDCTSYFSGECNNIKVVLACLFACLLLVVVVVFFCVCFDSAC